MYPFPFPRTELICDTGNVQVYKTVIADTVLFDVDGSNVFELTGVGDDGAIVSVKGLGSFPIEGMANVKRFVDLALDGDVNSILEFLEGSQ